jgi:hypothetical protein
MHGSFAALRMTNKKHVKSRSLAALGITTLKAASSMPLGMRSTSSAFRRTAQTPYKRLNFACGLPLRSFSACPEQLNEVKLSNGTAKRLNFAALRMTDLFLYACKRRNA